MTQGHGVEAVKLGPGPGFQTPRLLPFLSRGLFPESVPWPRRRLRLVSRPWGLDAARRIAVGQSSPGLFLSFLVSCDMGNTYQHWLC